MNIRNMRTRMGCIALLLLLSGSSLAQHLVRKGMLGVQCYNARPADSLPDAPGAWVQAIIPGSSAAAIGLQPLDRITGINGSPIGNLTELLQRAGQLRSGEPLSVSLTRGNDTLTLPGTVIAKPLETNEFASLLYDEFPFHGGYIRCILKSPTGQPPKGLVYFLPGIYCISLDNLPKDNPYSRIQDAFLKAGYQVYVVEKAGMGDSQNEIPCADMGFADEVDVYRQGFRHLFQYASVAPANVLLFGHSMGGIIAPILANEFRVKGIVVYGTGIRPWKEYLLAANHDQSILAGMKKSEATAVLQQLRPLVDTLFAHPERLEAMQKDSSAVSMLENIGYEKSSGRFAAGRTLQYQREIDTCDLAAYWKNVDARVLSLYGGADLAAYPGRDMKRIAELVNTTHPGMGEYRFVPKTEHGFHRVGRMKKLLQLMEEPDFNNRIKPDFNYPLTEDIIRWFNSL